MTEQFAHYDIKRRVGYGGYGTIYQAYDTNLRRDVVLKVLHHHLVAEKNMVKRFMREARAMAFVQHPNIVGIYSIEQGPPRPYIVMEYFESLNLESYLDNKAISLSKAMPILAQTAEAIDAAHRQSMIHRDIKPSNILVNKDGIVKVTDFGIAKRTQSAETTLTDPSIVLGTVWYMAPEQADINRQHEVGSSSDIYALGVVAYQMLVGRVPFDSKNKDVIMAAHRTQAPPKPEIYGVSLPPNVVKVLMKILAKQPDDRYKTARAFVDALRDAAELPLTEIERVPPSQGQEMVITNANDLVPVQIPKTTSINRPTGSKTHYRPLLTALAIVFILCLTASLYQASLNRIPTAKETPQALVQASFINLRQGPGEEYPVLKGYQQNATFRVVGQEAQGIWLQVETEDDIRGWVIADLLEVDQPFDKIAVVSTPTVELTPPAMVSEQSNPTADADNRSNPANPSAETPFGPSNPTESLALGANANETTTPIPTVSATSTKSPTATASKTTPSATSTVATQTATQISTQTGTQSATQPKPSVTSTCDASQDNTTSCEDGQTPMIKTQTQTQTVSAPSNTPKPATSTLFVPTETMLESTDTPAPSTNTIAAPTDTAQPSIDQKESTAIPSTNTIEPATMTVAPATNRWVPPTNTFVPPTNTYAPATNTHVPATSTPIPPTSAPAMPTHPYQVTLAGVNQERECFNTHQIFGLIQDQAGNPLSNVMLKVEHEYLFIEEYITTDSTGWYKVDILPVPARWYVQIINETHNALSPTIEVFNQGHFMAGHACWHQVNFSRVH